LPLPDGPEIRTGARVRATFRISSNTRRIASERPDHLPEASGLLELGSQCVELAFEPTALGDPLKDRLELSGPQRFQEVVRCAGAKRFDGVVDGARAGDDDGVEVRLGLLRLPEDFQPVPVGQRDVDHQQVRLKVSNGVGSLARRSDRERLASDAAELGDCLLEPAARRGVVLDDQSLQAVRPFSGVCISSASWRPLSNSSNARESSRRAVASAMEGSSPRSARRLAVSRCSETAESGVDTSCRKRRNQARSRTFPRFGSELISINPMSGVYVSEKALKNRRPRANGGAFEGDRFGAYAFEA
jgi:hypothetical protein